MSAVIHVCKSALNTNILCTKWKNAQKINYQGSGYPWLPCRVEHNRYSSVSLFVYWASSLIPLLKMLKKTVKTVYSFGVTGGRSNILWGLTRGVLCKASLLDDSKFGLDRVGRCGGWCWGWLGLHGDWGTLSGQAFWGLDPTGVGRQCPCMVGRSGSTPGTRTTIIYTCTNLTHKLCW